jgi:uncharacterized tellurite resistance protein B-like protein
MLVHPMPYSESEIRNAAVFVLVACAMADNIPAEEEIIAIKQKLIAHFHGRGSNIDDTIDNAIEKLRNSAVGDVWSVIEENVVKICPRDWDKELLLKDLEAIIEADGYISDSESRLYRQIKNLLQCS